MDLSAEFQADEDTREVNDEQDQWEPVSAVSPLAGTNDTRNLTSSQLNLPHGTKRKLEMWTNAQRDGRPAEYRWRPLFNAAKFGW